MTPEYGFRTIAALAVALATPALNVAIAQQTDLSIPAVYRHVSADSMSAADRSAVDNHQIELAQAARIYGYDLEAERWSFDQTVCAALPNTILLHYREIFPDGTMSLFTALVPRTSGRVYVVPVLYRNTTPYLPAPKNPHSYSVFNLLVPAEIAKKDATANGNWLELGACYAEMTGGDINIPSNPEIDVGSATAPLPAAHIDVADRTIRVTFADRESENKYRVWSISFDRGGRVKAATTDGRPVFATKNVSRNQPVVEEKSGPAQQRQGIVTQATTVQPQEVTGQHSNMETGAKSTALASESGSPSSPSAALSGVSGRSIEAPAETGWRLVTHPTDPPAKLIPPGSPPPEKIIPEPPDPTARPSTPPSR